MMDIDNNRLIRQEAISDILTERQRQVSGEGFDTERDDKYTNGELYVVAACYILGARWIGIVRKIWPASWSFDWYKSTTRRRDLVKAGALIIAELERMARADLAATKEKIKPKRERL